MYTKGETIMKKLIVVLSLICVMFTLVACDAKDKGDGANDEITKGSFTSSMSSEEIYNTIITSGNYTMRINYRYTECTDENCYETECEHEKRNIDFEIHFYREDLFKTLLKSVEKNSKACGLRYRFYEKNGKLYSLHTTIFENKTEVWAGYLDYSYDELQNKCAEDLDFRDKVYGYTIRSEFVNVGFTAIKNGNYTIENGNVVWEDDGITGIVYNVGTTVASTEGFDGWEDNIKGEINLDY